MSNIVLAESTNTELLALIDEHFREFKEGSIVNGTILDIRPQVVVVDIGYKSEGAIPISEFEDEDIEVGDEVEVLLERLEDDEGLIVLSKEKAAHKQNWEKILQVYEDGGLVKGKVKAVVKGGLMVNVGVEAFLPGSQVDIIPPRDLQEYVGNVYEFKIVKVNDDRKNLVLSRREVIEAERSELRQKFLQTVTVGDKVEGQVKNITDFGAFVDLEGMDGLLHITDMSWGRIGHPTEMVAIDQEIEVQVLHIDREREKIALGMKQRTPSPWAKVADKYPVDTVCKGTVVNVMSYGAFVKLEDGVEGLVHISEMSWTKRVSHPSELVSPGDEVDVVVLAINEDKQEISLGMKQTQQNPWEKVAADYPPGAIVKGVVRNLTNYGAFIEIDEGIDGLLHVTDMSWTRKVTHPSEVVEKGQEIECKVLSVDQQRRRIALGLKQMQDDPWTGDIPDRYKVDDVVHGTITKITNFGVFVGLEDGLEGLLHISELSDDKVENAEELVQVGDPIDVKILRVDIDERKIGLSRKQVDDAEATAPAESSSEGTA